MDHWITLRVRDDQFVGDCSCGEGIMAAIYVEYGISLDKVNQWAHEHIERAERAPLIR